MKLSTTRLHGNGAFGEISLLPKTEGEETASRERASYTRQTEDEIDQLSYLVNSLFIIRRALFPNLSPNPPTNLQTPRKTRSRLLIRLPSGR